jgi:uncharacterized protein (DUF362 family)
MRAADRERAIQTDGSSSLLSPNLVEAGGPVQPTSTPANMMQID